MNARLPLLAAHERWAIYFTFAGLPGACIFALFGFSAALVFELVAWLPQQRFFDYLRLGETITSSKS